ncbi:MAG: T9SS type A sorting domain-containing protein, partial [Crocinitomicaceae bacterium]|nr:T9SS type A sorting domain-containing protein [Crocinitomicaceae bacterium]
SAGTTLYSGGPYVNGTTNPEVTNMTLSSTDCYEFIINDAYGDGICCAYGNGSYTIVSGGNTLLTGGEFGDTESRLFLVELSGIEENTFVNGLEVYPNPANGVAHVDINLTQATSVAVNVYNALGQIVYTNAEGQMTAGNHTFDVDFTNLESGIYLVDVITGSKKITTRVSNMK